MAPGGAMLANFFMPNVVKLRQRQSEARTARRVRPPMYDGLLDDEDEEDDIIQLRRQRPETRGDHRTLYGHPRLARLIPYPRGDFEDYEEPLRVPRQGLRRREPDLPVDRRIHRRHNDFYDQDHELRYHSGRGSFAHSPESISRRHSSLCPDYYSDGDRYLGDEMSSGLRSYDRRRPSICHHHGIHHDYPPSSHRHNDYRERLHSQASQDSAARYGFQGGISRVNGPMSPNRDRIGQYSHHGSSSSDLTHGTEIE